MISFTNLIFLTSESEKFGINLDIIETNIINLAVVIGILVYYGSSLFLKFHYIYNRFLKIGNIVILYKQKMKFHSIIRNKYKNKYKNKFL